MKNDNAAKQNIYFLLSILMLFVGSFQVFVLYYTLAPHSIHISLFCSSPPFMSTFTFFFFWQYLIEDCACWYIRRADKKSN